MSTDTETQMKRLAIAVETLATMLLEDSKRLQLQVAQLLHAKPAKSKSLAAFFKYVAWPFAGAIAGTITHLLSHLIK